MYYTWQRAAWRPLTYLVIWSLVYIRHARSDPNDWVSVDYVVSEARQPSAPGRTTDALAGIVHAADELSGKGPWVITNGKNVHPPSNDPHDYLSWAPYHWPDCAWCAGYKRAQLERTGGNANNLALTRNLDDVNVHSVEGEIASQQHLKESGQRHHKRSANPDATKALPRNVGTLNIAEKELQAPIGIPSQSNTLEPTHTISDTSDSRTPKTEPGASITSASISHPQASIQLQAVAKTTRATCNPSPTKSLAPSATWTICPYIGRDGQVNPDVRTLNGPAAINDVSEFVLYSAIAFATERSPGYAQSVAKAVDDFFLSPSTKMNPNMNFGQVVRGPGPEGRTGTFTGILDLRGVVKVINGVLILKSVGSADWPPSKDRAMESWLSQYSGWLADSDIGKKTATRPNNHASFYVSQLAAIKMFSGDKDGAATILRHFFQTQFLDQIAASGEQPFEAVRTRPFHYRCFNIEALITNAKLGDALGLDFWSARSKYGATIQSAVDFLIASNPKGEDIQELVPHVASVAAAYGDPKGKYAAFTKKAQKDYQSKPFWFYDQPSALLKSPASSKSPTKRSVVWSREDGPIPQPVADVPFVCPAVFIDALEVEIDNGLFVTCEELRPLYEMPVPEIESL